MKFQEQMKDQSPVAAALALSPLWADLILILFDGGGTRSTHKNPRSHGESIPTQHGKACFTVTTIALTILPQQQMTYTF